MYNNLIIFLSELRKSLRILGISLIFVTVAIFFLSSGLISVFQDHLREKLYFFSVAGPFLAHVKVAFFGAIYLLMPLLMYVLWKALGKPFGVTGKKLFWFVFATCLLFYGGTLFCYLVTLPFGVKFLLGFQSENMKAVISIGRFVNFVTIFILAFGVIFELPVFMIFSAQVGVISRKTFEKNRRFAVLGIAILAALLTPTPDAVNMALMGVPLYLLYEAGILVIRMLGIEHKTSSPEKENNKEGEPGS
ncbi:MAG: preprotein translocase subunit TatC [Desulfobulbus sp.]|nr:MAG: preprotein translocase subunit TatC [Desulfobulbus sp.]